MELLKRMRESKKIAKREAKALRREARRAMKQQRQDPAEIAESQEPIVNTAQAGGDSNGND
jgi:hypothetical protein